MNKIYVNIKSRVERVEVTHTPQPNGYDSNGNPVVYGVTDGSPPALPSEPVDKLLDQLFVLASVNLSNTEYTIDRTAWKEFAKAFLQVHTDKALTNQLDKLVIDEYSLLKVALTDLKGIEDLRWIPYYWSDEKQEWVKLDYKKIQAYIDETVAKKLEQLTNKD